MPPAIRYCTTPAGRIAYCATGSGPPLLLDPGWVSHVGRQLELFSFGAFVAGLAERFTVIRYDKPGCGLSDRDAADLSFDTQVAAARYPERVQALVLYGTCADGRDLAPTQVRESIAPRTAETHVENIMRKLGVRSRAQIATWATEHRLSSG